MSTSGHLKFQGTNRATFVGTTSNIMFDTTSTSLGIGVTGTDHPSSNLYITGNAYVSSNIAVGGVLTMDTVNVITSLTAASNVVVTGNVTAGSFLGDGSELTALNAANIGSGTLDATRVPTLNQSTTGSAATLTTPRSIGGVDFNGSAAITPTTFTTATFSGDVCFGTGHTNSVGTVDIDPGASRSFSGSQAGPGHTPPLYVTASLGNNSNGVEFRHSNQSQGIGFGYNTIYATGGTGTSANQDLSLKAYNSGTVRLDGGTAISSDDRLKTNEEYITNATETLLKLKPQLYDKHKKINETCENPMREAGLITQDVYYDAPELRFLVHARNEGMDAIIPVNIPEEKPFVDEDPTKDPDYSGWGTDTASLNYEGFIPYLIKTIQELHERIDALENA